MRVLIASAIVGLALVAAVPTTASSPARPTEHCAKKGFFTGNLRVTNVGCHKGRRVVGEYFDRSQEDGDARQHILGFSCKGRNHAHNYPTIKCHKSHNRRIYYRGVLG